MSAETLVDLRGAGAAPAADLLDRLTDAIGRRLKPGFAVAVTRTRDPHTLLDAERAEIVNAVPSRRREFAAGRAALRMAAARAGRPICGAFPILVGEMRQPVLPPDISATLSHDIELAVAIAGPAGGPSPGVDIERRIHDSPALSAAVMPFAGGPAIAAFCIKEAVFKAEYANYRRPPGFQTIDVVMSETGFTARLISGTVVHGDWIRLDDRIAALAWG